ncbi:MAG: hypothetical protein AAFW64_09230 [Pseudomonadota bacterium]
MTDKAMTDKPVPIIRPYRPSDRAAVRRICCDTAYRNKGAEYLFEDREIHADYWSSYYTDVTPNNVSVVELDGQVIGYFFGCTDTRAFRRHMARRIVPSCLARALWRLATGRYKSPVSRRYLWFMLTKAAGEEAPMDMDRFPAHYHCNLTEASRGLQLYTQLTLDFLDQLEADGITGIHGFITEPAKRGIWDMFEKRYIELIKDENVLRTEKPTKSLEYIVGDTTPMVNRGWGCDIPVYRAYMQFLRDKMRI